MLVFGLAAGLLNPAVLPAFQETEETEPVEIGPPLAVINLAGVDRILTDVDALFRNIDRGDVMDMVKGGLEQVKDLKGMDRDKPFGAMLYLKPGFPPQPVPVGYFPVKSIGDLIKTVSIGPVSARKVPGEENRYEIEGPRQKLQVLLREDYAYVSNDEEFLTNELPAPDTFVRGLTSRYDVSASINIKAIPEATRSLFLTFLRTSTEAQLQQRDDEPDARFKARKAAGMKNLEDIEAVLKHGDSFVIGFDASSEKKVMVLEFELKATPDSPLAKEMKDITGKRTHFENALTDIVPLSASMNSKVNDRDAKLWMEMLEAGELELKDRLAESNRELDNAVIDQIFKSLRATVDSKHLDAFVQFQGEPPGKFVFLGGVKIERDNDLAQGIAAILKHFSDVPALNGLKIDAVNHQGVSFHRWAPPDVSGGVADVYGNESAVYAGVGQGVLWFAFGGEDAMPIVKQTMDRIADHTIPRNEEFSRPPFRAVVNMGAWMKIIDQENPNRFRDTAQEAFKKGGDQFSITVQPTENGFRFRVKFDEGFMRLLGLGVSGRIDRGFERRERRQRGEGRPPARPAF